MAQVPIPSLNSFINIRLNSAPKVEDPGAYEALLDIHSAIEILIRSIDMFVTQYKAVATKSASYSMVKEDGMILASASAAAVVITLPSAVGISGDIERVKAINTTFPVSVVPLGGQTIDTSAAAIGLVLYAVLTVKSDGANWWKI